MEEYKYKKQEKKKFCLSEEEKEGKECPNCHTTNDMEARFCAECGYDFSGERKCPKCGAKISLNDYICKYCGEWLLDKKCRFCHVDIEEGATYCPECGNLLREIVCPKCGQLSSFDFCPNCGTPLTPKAEEVYNKMKNEMGEAKISILFKNFTYTVEEKEEVKSHDEELLKMKKYIEKMDKKEKKKRAFTPLFSEKQKESIKKMDKTAGAEIKRQEEERRRQEEERRRLEEEKRRRQEEEKKKKEEAEKAKQIEEAKKKAEGSVYISKQKVTVIVKNEDGINDDTFWLLVNGNKVGLVSYPTGGSISYDVNLNKGINKVELKFDRPSGVGTVASINIENFKQRFGGGIDHIWMVINQ